jgi:hypothetical protein
LLQTTASGLGLWLASQPDPAFGLRKAGQLILGRKEKKKSHLYSTVLFYD